jgi:hypothetical protein
MTDTPNTTDIDQSEHTPAPVAEPTDRTSVRHWLRATLVRAVKTAAQSAVAIIPVSAVTIGSVDWLMVCLSSFCFVRGHHRNWAE